MNSKLREERILQFLAANSGWHSINEIAQAIGSSHASVSRSVERLHDESMVRRMYGAGNSIIYKGAKIDPVATTTYRQVQPVDMVAALRVFSRGHKLPKFIETESYKAYAQTVAGLYQQAVEVAYGEAPLPQELLKLRTRLLHYRDELEAHLLGIQAILNTQDLWDPGKSSTFLLISGPLEELQKLADKAAGDNK